ncbi:uroporphyrinogen-III C-methyltransferase [Pseudobutyrivibrio sp.]
MSGKVVLLGAGPGEWGLLTLKGAEIIKKADCVIYDRLLNAKFLELTKPGCEKIFVGKENHFHVMPQEEINKLLLQKAGEHQLVVRLKGGDPYVFGRGGEEACFLLDNGVEVDVIPGISSSVAALTAAGIPITYRGLSKGFQVITAHSRKDKASDIDYSKLTDESVTLVFLMGLSHVGKIADGLIGAGRSKSTKVAVISNATTNHQKKCVGTLDNIAALVEKAALVSPATIVVGDVVSLNETLGFFESRPLFGKTYFLPKIKSFEYGLKGSKATRSNELEIRLEELGAEVIPYVAGQIVPKKVDVSLLENASESDVIVFTSANGVKAFFYNLFEGARKDLRYIPNCHFAVVGKKTFDTLASFGIIADIISTKQSGVNLAEAINKKVKEEANVYWLCAKKVAGGFEESLDSRFRLNKLVSYENISSDAPIEAATKEKIIICDGAIFTSGSTAAASIDALEGSLPDCLYSIGESCSNEIRKKGYDNILEAKISSYPGIVELLLAD